MRMPSHLPATHEFRKSTAQSTAKSSKYCCRYNPPRSTNLSNIQGSHNRYEIEHIGRAIELQTNKPAKCDTNSPGN